MQLSAAITTDITLGPVSIIKVFETRHDVAWRLEPKERGHAEGDEALGPVISHPNATLFRKQPASRSASASEYVEYFVRLARSAASARPRGIWFLEIHFLQQFRSTRIE